MTVKHAGPKNSRHFCVERASRNRPLCRGLRVFSTIRGSTSALRPSQSVTAGYSTLHSMSRTSIDWARNERSSYVLFCARCLGVMCHEPNAGSRLSRQYDWDPECHAWLQADREVAARVERRRLLQSRE